MAATASFPATRRRLDRDDLLMRGGICLLIGWLLITLVLPLWWLLSKSFEDDKGAFVGLANYIHYFSTPALFQSVWNSLLVSVVSTAIVLPLAFTYAYALQRTHMRWKGLFQALALIPILAPSLLPAISFIYLFGNQGFLKGLMFGREIYGFAGIVISQVFYCFPHALMILVAALSMADARLYEAADALGASKMRVFFTVTLPGAKYGVISAGFVIFTLVITDFGIAKVIGGQFNVLATDIYKQVIGQQNFGMGAVVGFVLLIPAVFAFAADRIIQRRQVALLSARSVPLIPKAVPRRDWSLFAFCAIVGGLILGVLLMAVWASLVTRWPYNLALTLKNYAFGDFDSNGWGAYWNSLVLRIMDGRDRNGGRLSRRLPAREDARLRVGPGHGAADGDAADGGAGAGARPRLYLLLQCQGQPAGLHLRDDDHPRRQFGDPLLHGQPPDRHDVVEAARPGIRGGVRIAQGVAAAHDGEGDGPDLSAFDSRHQHLPLRQCDDHRLRGDLPLFDGHQARGDLDHSHGRGWIHRRRGRDGGDHRGHLGRGEDHPCPADAPVRPHDAGLAQAR